MGLQRVWVTGAKGFTGQYVVSLLKDSNIGVDTTEVDISNKELVEQHIHALEPDALIHLAAMSYVPDGVDSSIYAVNSFGTENILQACATLATPPRRIILASTANIYGRQHVELVTEESAALPLNHYGYSKWVMERVAAGFNNELNITITRPFNYTGVGQNQKFLVPKLTAHFRQKMPDITLGNIDVWRDFSDVRWVAQVYRELLLLDEAPDVVNISSQRLTSIRDMIALLEDLSGHHITIQHDESLMRAHEIKKQVGSHQRLFDYIPTLVTPIPIEKTLEWMLKS